jgi:hypothetical protein
VSIAPHEREKVDGSVGADAEDCVFGAIGITGIFGIFGFSGFTINTKSTKSTKSTNSKDDASAALVKSVTMAVFISFFDSPKPALISGAAPPFQACQDDASGKF